MIYRDPLASNAELVAGSSAAAAVPPGTVAVAVTPQTAARFGLRAGSRMTLSIPGGTVTLAVTAHHRAAASRLHLLDAGQDWRSRLQLTPHRSAVLDGRGTSRTPASWPR